MAFTDRLHNRGSISSGYDVSNSILMSGDDNDRGSYAYASGGNRYKQTFSMWVKRVKPGANEYLWESGNADSLEGRVFLRFQSDNRLRVSTGTSVLRQTLMEFNDTSAWYHIVVVIDNTQATASNRVKIYVNGRDVSVDGWDASNDMNQNQNTGCGVGNLYLNYSGMDNNGHANQYIAQFATLNNQNLGPEYFAETNADGEWVPKDLTSLSWGNHDMWLEFDNSGSLGTDNSGQGHNMTISAADSTNQSQDSPTNNFCTLNNNSRNNGNIHSEHGGTYVSTDGGSGWCSMNATMGVQNGKWYWETKRIDTYVMVGIAGWNDPWIPHRNGGYYTGNVATSGSLGIYFLNGNIYNDANYPDVPGVATGETLGLALDMNNGSPRLYLSKNGVFMTGTGSSQMDPVNGNYGINVPGAFGAIAGATDIILPSVSVYQGNDAEFNFGGYTKTTISSGQSDANGYGNFEYAPPTGYYALCSKNLGEFG